MPKPFIVHKLDAPETLRSIAAINAREAALIYAEDHERLGGFEVAVWDSVGTVERFEIEVAVTYAARKVEG